MQDRHTNHYTIELFFLGLITYNTFENSKNKVYIRDDIHQRLSLNKSGTFLSTCRSCSTVSLILLPYCMIQRKQDLIYKFNIFYLNFTCCKQLLKRLENIYEPTLHTHLPSYSCEVLSYKTTRDPPQDQYPFIAYHFGEQRSGQSSTLLCGY